MSEDDHAMPSGSSSKPDGKDADGTGSGPQRPSAKGSSGAKSAKALRAAKSRSGGGRSAGQSVVNQRQIPWVTLAAAVVVVAFVVAVAVYLVPKYESRAEAQKYVPTSDNTDPSKDIDGVVKLDYPAGQHVQGTQRVGYDKAPPFGGPHDQVWATCTGIVYPNAVRTENEVHSLEHGAIWIAYNPDLPAEQVQALAAKVTGKPYMLMSPYPGLDSPISLQSWGHQLKLTDASDTRVDEFITALRQNSNTYPEVGASCDTANTTLFDPDNPPPFEPLPAPADAVPMSGTGTSQGDITDPSQLQTGTGATGARATNGAGGVPSAAVPPVTQAPASVDTPAPAATP